MAFYLKPPVGNIPLHRLYDLAAKRLSFLLQLSACDDDTERFFHLLEAQIEESECLNEGNIKDRISHFILRFACSVLNNQIKEFFIDMETRLFRLRFGRMSINEKLRLLRHIERNLKEIWSLGEIAVVLKSVVRQIQSSLQLDVKNTNGIDVRDKFIKVPFQHILPLVASRSVLLERGVALVPVHLVDVLLESLFRKLLMLNISLNSSRNNSICDHDARMDRLCEGLQAIFDQNRRTKLSTKQEQQSVSHADVDKESLYFPPCMKIIHEQLRSHHRLNHSVRIRYTLFLKDIGLSVDEALLFWGKEYSQPPACKNRCSHGWDQDKKRYVYNIRHLYGLEGSKTNYSSHTCPTIQGRSLGFLSVGCPFRDLDIENLKTYFQNLEIGDTEAERIRCFAEQGHSNKACAQFLLSRLNSSADISSGANKRKCLEMDVDHEDKLSESPLNGRHKKCLRKFENNSHGQCETAVHGLPKSNASCSSLTTPVAHCCEESDSSPESNEGVRLMPILRPDPILQSVGSVTNVNRIVALFTKPSEYFYTFKYFDSENGRKYELKSQE